MTEPTELLFNACKKGKLAEVKNLVEDGMVKVDYKNDAGLTPILCASMLGHIEVVQYLVTEGGITPSDSNPANNTNNNTALHWACYKGHLDLVAFLLDAGFSIEDPDSTGNHPLHLAATSGHFEIIELLLGRAAETSVTNDFGNAALDLAVDESVRSLLLNAMKATYCTACSKEFLFQPAMCQHCHKMYCTSDDSSSSCIRAITLDGSTTSVRRCTLCIDAASEAEESLKSILANVRASVIPPPSDNTESSIPTCLSRDAMTEAEIEPLYKAISALKDAGGDSALVKSAEASYETLCAFLSLENQIRSVVAASPVTARANIIPLRKALDAYNNSCSDNNDNSDNQRDVLLVPHAISVIRAAEVECSLHSTLELLRSSSTEDTDDEEEKDVSARDMNVLETKLRIASSRPGTNADLITQGTTLLSKLKIEIEFKEAFVRPTALELDPSTNRVPHRLPNFELDQKVVVVPSLLKALEYQLEKLNTVLSKAKELNESTGFFESSIESAEAFLKTVKKEFKDENRRENERRAAEEEAAAKAARKSKKKGKK